MLKIGILGAGTVGSGVVKILTEKKSNFESKLGYPIQIKSIAVKDINKNREEYFKGIHITDNCEEIVNDPEINVIVELIGGSNPAGKLILKAIENGKHIVTANKEVLAKYGK
ncbi:MAG: Gfo/Idh/MocA family oxidoreductase, partial [Candidatus Sericytochromatia bacterium]